MNNGCYVRYIPPKAAGDPHHPSCDNGYVVGQSDLFIFVAFSGNFLAEPCDPKRLVEIEGI